MSVTINGNIVEYKKGIRAIDFIGKEDKSIIACKIDNKLRDLAYEISDNSNVVLLGFDDYDSARVYEASLRFVFVMAAKRVFPFMKVNCDYYISRSICFRNSDGFFSDDQFEKISNEMKDIIENDYAFKRKNISKEDAVKYYRENGFDDKVEVMEYRPEADVHVYECCEYKNYMYSYMVPSTGYLIKYNLFLRNGVIVLQYPRAELNGDMPSFVEENTYEETLIKASEWGKINDSLTVTSINKNVLNNTSEFILKCENRHKQMIDELKDKIASNKKIKLIAIAGPSSSGKTTFSNKLRVALEKEGIYPVKISMDDYYLDRSHLSKEEEKKVDYEDINLIDIPLFNKHLKELTEGKEVVLPKFDFVTKKRLVGKKMKLDKNAPIIIEGIHALNEALTASLAREEKFEIYIGPHVQINIDDHNPISITHMRVIRRLVRDYRTRGAQVDQTLSMWDAVRKGEFKWIYENQEGVDYVYNSILDYEFCVMKKYAIPLLNKVSQDSAYYNFAKTLIKYFKYFVDISDESVPKDSLLREFIGGSCYEE